MLLGDTLLGFLQTKNEGRCPLWRHVGTKEEQKMTMEASLGSLLATVR